MKGCARTRRRWIPWCNRIFSAGAGLIFDRGVALSSPHSILENGDSSRSLEQYGFIPRMIRPLAAQLQRLDSVYRLQPYFVGQRARLLAGFNVLLLVFAPINIAKLLWVMP